MKKMLLLFISLVILMYFVLYFRLRSQKYSSFYVPNVEQLEASNNMRIKTAKDYFLTHNNIGMQNRKFAKNTTQQQICIGILTSPRKYYKSRRYLLQCLYSILSPLSYQHRNRKNIHLAVLTPNGITWNDKTDFNDHRIDLEIIRPFVDKIIFTKHQNRKQHTKKSKTFVTQWLYNESNDYLAMLKHCYLNTVAETILLVEDDSFASPNLYEQLTNLIIKNVEVSKENNNNAYIKLFATEYFFGFENSDFLCLLFIFLTVTYFSKKYFRTGISSSCCVGILFILILEISGKQNIVSPFFLKSGVNRIPYSSIDSNTVAVLFHDRKKVKNLIAYMEKSLINQDDSYRRYETDLILDQWSKTNKFDRMYYIPSLFQQ
jgi:hypothetical protein